MKALRGAIAPVNNMPEAIGNAAVNMVTQLCQANNLTEQDIVMMIFSATRDIYSAYPAEFIRRAGFSQVPMLCLQEMEVEGSIRGCIRVMVLINRDLPVSVHVYLGEARQLRPDLAGDCNGN